MGGAFCYLSLSLAEIFAGLAFLLEEGGHMRQQKT